MAKHDRGPPPREGARKASQGRWKPRLAGAGPHPAFGHLLPAYREKAFGSGLASDFALVVIPLRLFLLLALQAIELLEQPVELLLEVAKPALDAGVRDGGAAGPGASHAGSGGTQAARPPQAARGLRRSGGLRGCGMALVSFRGSGRLRR